MCMLRVFTLAAMTILSSCFYPDCNYAQELDILLEEAAKSGVQPVIGLRAKLATRHGGHWGTTSGENAKFGLSPATSLQLCGNWRLWAWQTACSSYTSI